MFPLRIYLRFRLGNNVCLFVPVFCFLCFRLVVFCCFCLYVCLFDCKCNSLTRLPSDKANNLCIFMCVFVRLYMHPFSDAPSPKASRLLVQGGGLAARPGGPRSPPQTSHLCLYLLCVCVYICMYIYIYIYIYSLCVYVYVYIYIYIYIQISIACK